LDGKSESLYPLIGVKQGVISFIKQMNKEYSTVEELLADESFQGYVMRSDVDSGVYWMNWATGRTDRQEMLQLARTQLLQLSLQPTDEEILDAHLELKEQMKVRKFNNLTFANRIQKSQFSSSSNLSNPIPSLFSKLKTVIPVIFVALTLMAGAALYLKEGAAAKPKITSIGTSYGEVLTRRLADGSTVTLNGNSKLSIQELSGKYPRRMVLEGEAFFEINKAPLIGGQKCEIITSQGTISVLGTSFNVRDRGADFEVLLTEGKVRLIQKDAEIIEMDPGDLIAKDAVGNFNMSKVNPAMYVAWKDHHMVFKQVSIDRVVSRLNEDYGIEVTVLNESLKNKEINANIKNDDPKILLETLAAIHQLKLSQPAYDKFILE